MHARAAFYAARLNSTTVVKTLTSAKPSVGRVSARSGKLIVKAVQAGGIQGDDSSARGKGKPLDPSQQERLASNFAATTSGAAAALEGPLSAIKSLITAYNDALAKHPVATKAVTSLIGFALGDRIAQSVGGAPFDVLRMLRLSMYGVLIDGPIGHYFYQFLDKNISPEDPKGTRAVVTKTAIDQLVWAPIMTVVFLAFLTTLEGHPDAIMSVLQAKVVPILIANFSLWPLVHLINFRYVPPEQRILFNNCVAVAWTTYLSLTCGASTGHAGTPRDALAAGLPCAAQAAAAVLNSHHVAGMVRQTAAVESMLHGWGADGLPAAEAGAELLLNYAQLKSEMVRTVCGAHTMGP